MRNRSIILNGEEYQRITKVKALNILGKDKTKKIDNFTVYVLPCNLNPSCPFVNGFFEITTDFKYCDFIDYLQEIREIEFYNCNVESGEYLSFYIKKGGWNVWK